MVDPDPLLTAAQIAARLPPRRQGRPTDPDTIRGYVRRGLAGVRLRCEVVGGSPMVRWSWLQDFFRRAAAARARRREAARRACREAS